MIKNLVATKLNDTGEAVARLHEALELLGFQIAPGEKGKTFGPATEATVKSLQQLLEMQTQTGEVDNDTVAAFNTLIAKKLISAPRQIDGCIILQDGRPAQKLQLRLYRLGTSAEADADADADADSIVATTDTDETGHYTFPNDVQLGTTAFEIRAFTGKEIVLSAPLAPESIGDGTTINLIAPTDLQPVEKTEYERLSAALTKSRKELTQIEAVAMNGASQDLSLLSRMAGWDARLIALSALSDQLAKDPDVQETGLASAALYGLLRAGLPSDKSLLLRVAPDVVAAALKKARDAGIVQLNDQQITDAEKKLTAISIRPPLATTAPHSNSTYSDLLQSSGISADAQEKFASVFFRHQGSGNRLWDEAVKSGLGGADIGTLQLHGKLAFLTGNSSEMISRLMEKSLRSPADLVERNLFTATAWESEIRAQAGIAQEVDPESGADLEKLEALIPSTYKGTDVLTRLNAYAEDMARKIRLSYPTQVLTHLMENDFNLNKTVHKDTVKLLKDAAAQGFKLGKTPIWAFLKANKGLLNLSDDASESDLRLAIQKPVVQQLNALQRVYQITPDNESLHVLLALGTTSAFDIMAFSEDQFASLFNSGYLEIHEKASRNDIAEQIYRKARQVSSVSYNLFSIAKILDSETPVLGLSASAEVRESVKSELIKHYPSMESLFGSMDFCECEHCRSVLSPAAYLVDLLQFIDTEPQVWDEHLKKWKEKHTTEYKSDWTYKNGQQRAPKDRKPYDALIERRPDLPYIALTCKNTNTTLPYIDIVNEILEYYVANDRLAEKAARDTGDATTEELLAEPQYVIREAYTTLSEQKYPLNLPFDLWLESVRSFSNYFNTPLHQLMEVFRTDEDTSGMHMESLGISPNEAGIFFDSSPLDNWWKLYGVTNEYKDETSGEDVKLSSAKVLARRLGVTYKEIADIVQTGFVNPDLSKLALLYRLGIGIQDARLYKEEEPFYEINKGLQGKNREELSGEDQTKFDELAKVRDNRNLTGWQVLNEVAAIKQRIQDLATSFRRSVEDLAKNIRSIPFDKIILLSDPNTGCNFDLTTLQYASGTPLTNIPADEIYFLRINLFVRLWRKLGWSIEETDRTLTTFIPRSTPFDNKPENLEQIPLKTALFQLAHFKVLNEKLQLGTQGRLRLLPLWSNIDTTGKKPLYEELFLTRSVLRYSPEFDNPFGEYLNDKNADLENHLLVLQRALGLTAEDIGRIRSDVNIDGNNARLSLDNVSHLYRYSVLAKAMNLSVRELITLKQLSGINPFTLLDSKPLQSFTHDGPHPLHQTLEFIKIVDEIRDSGLSIDEINYYLRHEDPTGKFRSDSEKARTLLMTLKKDVQEICSKYALPNVEEAVTDEWLQQKFGLIFQPEVLERLLVIIWRPEVSEENAHDLFDRLILTEDIRSIGNANTITRDDFAKIFTSPADTPGKQQNRRDAIASAYIPILQRCLSHLIIVKTITTQTNADISLVKSFVVDKDFLAGANTLLDSLILSAAPIEDSAEATYLTILLSKALSLIEHLGLSEREIRYFLTYGDDFDGLNKIGDILAVPGSSPPAVAAISIESRFKRLRRLTSYSKLKRELASGTDELISIFEASREAINTDKPGSDIYSLISRLTRQASATIKETAESLDKKLTFDSEKPLWRLWEALKVVERFGIQPASLKSLAEIVTASEKKQFEIARELKEALKAKLEPKSWQRMAQPIFDQLRKRQRDALVSHVMQQRGFQRMEELYEYFLIDPGMEPVVQTSRIRLATSSLQLFIQLCLLNREQHVHPTAINAKHWEWMKRYRVWEANRKIFLFPENWLEPEFRDDKTHLFSELESALLQGDVSSDLVEDAFLNYLRKLDELARLDICAMHIDQPPNQPSTLHVFGRTFNQPHKYFYRRYIHKTWTHWEPVSAEIEGDHLAPVIWRDRLYLFWVTFMEKGSQTSNSISVKSPNKESGSTTFSIPDAKKDIEVQLHWSEYLNGEWTTHESSGFNAPNPLVVSGLRAFDPTSVFIHVSKEYDPEDGSELGVFIHMDGAIYRAFYLAGRNSSPEIGAYRRKSPTPFTDIYSPAVTRYHNHGSLTVNFDEHLKKSNITAQRINRNKLIGHVGDSTLVPCNNGTEDNGLFLVSESFGYRSSMPWQPWHPRFVVDLTGDGRADIIGFHENGVNVQLNRGDGAFENISLALEGQFKHSTEAGGWDIYNHPIFLADVFGNGRPDIVGFANDGVFVARNEFVGDGKNFSSSILALKSFGASNGAGGWEFKKHPRFLADLTGDGRVDIIGFHDDGVHVALNESTKESAAFKALSVEPIFGGKGVGDWTAKLHPRLVVDLTGDGCADIIGFGASDVYVALNDGTGHFRGPKNAVPNFFAIDSTTGSWRVDRHLRFLSDITGSGLPDIVGFHDNGVYVARNIGNGMFSPPELALNEFGYNQGWLVERNPRYLVDLTGDGRADIVGFANGGVFVALNKGNGRFHPPYYILTEFGAETGDWAVDKNPRLVADLTGTGRADIVGFSNTGVMVGVCFSTFGNRSNELASLLKPVFYQDNKHTFFIEPQLSEKTTAEWDEWVAGEQQPVYQQLDQLNQIAITPVVATSKGAAGESPTIDKASLIQPESKVDWLINAETLMQLGDVLIGPTGQKSITDDMSKSAVGFHSGNNLLGGGASLFQGENSFAQSSLKSTSGDFRVVGRSGFGGVLKQGRLGASGLDLGMTEPNFTSGSGHQNKGG